MTLQNNLMQKSTGGVNPTHRPVAGIGSARAPIRSPRPPELDLPEYSLPTDLARPGQIAPDSIDPGGLLGRDPLGLQSVADSITDNQSNIIVGLLGLALIAIALVQIVKPV